MDSVAELPFHIQKQQALTRRAGKLIEWLERPEYAVYTDENSITHLVKLIDLIVWALEKSLPLEQWRPFRQRLMDARNAIVDIVETENEEKENFYRAIPMLITTLQDYSDYISKA